MKQLITRFVSLLVIGSSVIPFTAAASVIVPVPLQLHAIVPETSITPPLQHPAAYANIGAALSATLPDAGSPVPQIPSLVALPQHTTGGNSLLSALPALFVLNALFANQNTTLLTPGPASLHNILTLYEIFFDR